MERFLLSAVFLLLIFAKAQDERCPGLRSGKIKQRDMTGSDCITGNRCPLDGSEHVIMADHNLAFGVPANTTSWRECLPHYPAENHRVCYRTTVDKCGVSSSPYYRIFVKRRNSENLKKCNENEALSETGNNEIIFSSPRYMCRKKSGYPYHYRRAELCLYNISIPDCESGVVFIESEISDRQILQERCGNTCADYLQFYYNSSTTSRFCGTELSHDQLNLTIPATQFMAVFWTDFTTNALGFRLLASCFSGLMNKTSNFMS